MQDLKKYCHKHSSYNCNACMDELVALGIQADKDRIAALEKEVYELEFAMRTAINFAENGCADLAAKALRIAHGDLFQQADT